MSIIEQHHFDDEPLPTILPYTKAAILSDLRSALKVKQLQVKKLEIEIESISKTLAELL